MQEKQKYSDKTAAPSNSNNLTSAQSQTSEAINRTPVEIIELYNDLLNIMSSKTKGIQSDAWATGHGINEALEEWLGKSGGSVHIIPPDRSSVESPAASDGNNALEGAIQYAKEISGFSSNGEMSNNHIIHKDGETLKKPIVMILNTAPVKANSSTDTRAIGGNHWQCCVILPKNYKPPYADKNLGNDREMIFYVDSLYPNLRMPRLFQQLLTEGLEYKFKVEGQKYTHIIPGAFAGAEVIDGITICPQVGGADCGWWAVYNAMMIVFTGNVEYLNQFKDKIENKELTREPGYKLRALLTGLTKEAEIGTKNKLATKAFWPEEISQAERLAIQQAIIESLRELSKGKDKTGKIKKNKDKPVIKLPMTKKYSNYYPNDLMHGILAAHCADETGKYAGKSNVKEGNQVIFSGSNALYNHLLNNINNNNLDLNDYAKEWRVIKVIDEAETGYLGIIYGNDLTKQLVLAHRSTNFALSLLTNNLGRYSGAEADIDGVLKGNITSHQGDGYIATKEAIELVRSEEYVDYSLSTTGHSLGSWLAQLSTYYAAIDFKYNLKSVDFDGPGVREMIEQLINNRIDAKFNIDELDITSYLSAPNIVNCANKHLGNVYRMLADIPNDHTSTQAFLNLFGKEAVFNTIFGHDLTYLIPYFDKDTGRPKECSQVIKWPSITYQSFALGGAQNSTFVSLLKNLPLFLSSAFQITNDITAPITGAINQRQFWKAHQYLDKDNRYMAKLEITEDDKKSFELSYIGNYEVKNVQLYQRAVKDSIDKQLVKLATEIKPHVERASISQELLITINSLTDKYEVKQYPTRRIIVKADYRDSITIMDIREMMREIMHRQKDAYKDVAKQAIDLSKSIEQSIKIANYLPQEAVEHYIEPAGTFEKIDNIFERSQKVIISAFAGTGKSSCALQYAYRQKNQGVVVRWFDAGSKGKLELAYRSFAETLEIKVEGLDHKMLINMVNNKLVQSNKRLLFIFDNVEKEKNVELNYITEHLLNLPTNIQIIITARNPKLLPGSKKIRIELEPFNEKEATTYITESLSKKITEQQTKELVDKLKLNLLPQRLKGIVAYLKNKSRLKSKLAEKEIRQFVVEYQENDTITNLLLQSITNIEDSKLWQILQYAAYLDPDFINIAIIKELVEKDEDILAGYIEELSKLSLITKVTKDEYVGIKIHRLVQQDIKRYQDKYAKQKMAEQDITNDSLIALNQLLPTLTYLPGKDWQLASSLLISMAGMLQEKDQEGNGNSKVHAQLYSKIGLYYKHIVCDFEKDLTYQLKALKIYQALYRCDHPDIASSLNNVGSAYQEKGKLEEALDYLEKSLKIRRELQQVHLPAIASLLNIVRADYQDKGELDKAQNFEQALKACEVLYEVNHVALANSLNNVGSAYKEKGELDKALNYLKESLEMRQTLHQGNHFEIARSLNNVGSAYKDKGELDKALYYQKQALKMRQALCKGNHPDIANSLNNIGSAYYKDKGKLEKGLNYLEQALKMRQALYPGNHPNVAISLNNIGMAYHEKGELDKALNYLEQGLKMFKVLYLGNHPDVALLLDNVGLVYQKKGELETGINYLEQALKMRQALYQGNHPVVAGSLNNVGLAYQQKREFDKGLNYQEQALKVYKAFYQGNHSDLATLLNNVGWAYKEKGELDKGLGYLEQALEMRQVVYQENHPDIAISFNNVGMTYKAKGELWKGLNYIEQALKMYQAVHQGNHPNVATLLDNLGVAYQEKGELDRALDYLKKALEMRQELYPVNHPEVASSLNNLGVAYQDRGELDKALYYMKQASDRYQNLPNRYQNLYTDNHPDIVNLIYNLVMICIQKAQLNKIIDEKDVTVNKPSTEEDKEEKLNDNLDVHEEKESDDSELSYPQSSQQATSTSQSHQGSWASRVRKEEEINKSINLNNK